MSGMSVSFTDYLTLARTGDQNAVGELLERWRPLLRLQAHVLLRSELARVVDPSDIVQETFMQAVHDLGRFRGRTEGEWVAWLRTIAAGHVSKAIRFHRAAKRNPARQISVTETYPAASTSDPAKRIVDQERAARLTVAIEALPDAMREVIVRRTLEREPFEQMAHSLGRSTGAVRVLWTRAIRRLRDSLESET
jgi:RNA polymerase sigma-70 factor (ECF subfamily)